jgi:hypothetical protein
MPPELIAEDGSYHRQHGESLRNLLSATTGLVRITSPYITDNELPLADEGRRVRLLTSLDPWDIASQATSLTYMRSLIQSGVLCKSFTDSKLHAKVYIFGRESAVITSANLTYSGLNSNIEVGVTLTGGIVRELVTWFDGLWKRPGSTLLDTPEVERLEETYAPLRRRAAALRRRMAARASHPTETIPHVRSQANLRELLDSAPRFFVCNTNRRWSPGREDEELMRRTRHAVVWETFYWPAHMERVTQGDAIFMFAKKVGIIGIGRAKGGVTISPPGDSERIRKAGKTPEWRVSVDEWLAWVEHEADAYKWAMRNASFMDISGDEYHELRDGVRRRFLRKS